MCGLYGVLIFKVHDFLIVKCQVVNCKTMFLGVIFHACTY